MKSVRVRFEIPNSIFLMIALAGSLIVSSAAAENKSPSEEIRDLLAAPHSEEVFRQACSFGEDSIGIFCELLSNSDDLTRYRILDILYAIGSSEATPCVANLLNRMLPIDQENLAVFMNALRVLRNIGDERAENALLQYIADDIAVEGRSDDGGRLRADLRLSSADVLLHIGTPQGKARATEFVLSLASEMKEGKLIIEGESWAWLSMGSALCAIGTSESDVFLRPFITDSLVDYQVDFSKIPRNSDNVDVVQAIYDFLRGDPSPYGPEVLISALIALAEMPLSKELIPREFFTERLSTYSEFLFHLPNSEEQIGKVGKAVQKTYGEMRVP